MSSLKHLLVTDQFCKIWTKVALRRLNYPTLSYYIKLNGCQILYITLKNYKTLMTVQFELVAIQEEDRGKWALHTWALHTWTSEFNKFLKTSSFLTPIAQTFQSYSKSNLVQNLSHLSIKKWKKRTTGANSNASSKVPELEIACLSRLSRPDREGASCQVKQCWTSLSKPLLK